VLVQHINWFRRECRAKAKRHANAGATVVVILIASLVFVTSCNNIQKPKSMKKLTDRPLTASVYFYLLKYNNGFPVSGWKDDFLKSLETVNESVINLNQQILNNNHYDLWRRKINRIDSTELLIEGLDKLNNNLRYYFWLNYKSDLLKNPPVKVRDKVLTDAFFINNGFDFYSDLWYLNPYLTIDQNSYFKLIEQSELFNLVLTGFSDDMTDLTAKWIRKEDDDGMQLPVFRTINPDLAKKLKNELASKFLSGSDKKNASFQLLDDFLTKEVNKQALVLLEYTE
jgi:hypothetical protein